MNILCFLLIHFCQTPITDTSVIRLTNQARQHAQLKPLQENFRLDLAASRKANDMVKRHYFAHVTPTGLTPWDFIVAAHYDYHYAGENLAIDYSTAEQQEQAWFNSPEHKANQLNPLFTQTGVATAKDTNGKIVTVQLFGTP